MSAKNFRKTLITSMALLGTASLVQAQFPQEQQPAQSSPQRIATENDPQSAPQQEVVAKVNGDAITTAEFQAAVQTQIEGGQVPPEAEGQVRQQILNGLVESRLVEQFVIKEGPKVEPQEVETVVERYETQLQTQGVELGDFLKSRGYSEKTFKKRIEGSLGWQKYQQQELTDQNLLAHFQQNMDRFSAQDFNQAKPEVARSYAGELWKSIVEKSVPEAKIEISESAGIPPAATSPPTGTVPGQTP